ncbi:sialidase family protein [Thalassoroseus pseudoceratinae]|uniref:sialidase family protein n=1 Tax=Thalassoroseus pseudoceratinae TaxID=2713176 RepID=UPI00141E68DB|nr:sialidase family protein [Thalassoroseus pseudoceratinae]
MVYSKVAIIASCFLSIVVTNKGMTQEVTSPFKIERTVATQGFDGKFCWVHARAGAVPSTAGSEAMVVMTLQKLQLSGSDVFYALNEMRTTNLGKSWTPPVELQSFARVPFAFDGHDDLEMTVCDFTPQWHAKTETLLGTGHTVVYENNRVRKIRPREVAYAVYHPSQETWAKWRTVELPNEPKFRNAGAGCGQRADLQNGEVLLPIYFKEIGETQYATTVLRCQFDGETLRYREHGTEMSVDVKRGLAEPSITEYDGRYFLTMRNDDHGYVSVSEGNDSLKFSPPKKWTFDDGSDLGNYNTQQHWVRHPIHGLWLVYTRRGADNDHVFRHRAPLFIAKVDPERLHVIRATEQIVVPEKGARLGNFGITEVSENETWITATEWMQGIPPNPHDPRPLVKRGADNRVWVVKLNWAKSASGAQ